MYFFFFRISSSHNYCQLRLLEPCTGQWPNFEEARFVWWSMQWAAVDDAVCSGSPHSHAALSASPHFFMDALYRPTPVRSLFRVVQCFRLISSPLTPSSGSDTWRCTRVGPDAPHSCFHVAARKCADIIHSWLRPLLRGANVPIKSISSSSIYLTSRPLTRAR